MFLQERWELRDNYGGKGMVAKGKERKKNPISLSSSPRLGASLLEVLTGRQEDISYLNGD